MSPPTSTKATATTPPRQTCPPTPSPSDAHLFTCTFCWHPSTGAIPPRVVGRSARLVCEPCYAALIDLSVCWLCGEVVFRGDECVSLGWCFWHRACYGCLLCGSGNVVRGVGVGELFAHRGEEAVGGGDGMLGVRGRAREVNEIPLCAQCCVEVEGVGTDSGTAVTKALRRMEYYDSGLSRKRWEARQAEMAGSVDEIQASVLSDETIFRSGGGDGSICEPVQTRQGAIKCRAPLDSSIYVSIFDPINQPAFKPSPVKPIPTWMLPPGLRKTRYGSNQQPPISSKEHPGHPSNSHPVTPPRQAITESITPYSANRLLYTAAVASTLKQGTRPGRVGLVSNEPLKRPSLRLGRFRDTSSYDDPRTPLPYLTPPEYPASLSGDVSDYFLDKNSRGPQSPNSVHKALASDPASLVRLPRRTVISPPRDQATHDSPSLRASVVTKRSKSPAFIQARLAFEKHGSPPLPMSSEYLDKYQPVGPSSRREPANLIKFAPVVRRKSLSTTERKPKGELIIAQITKNTRVRPSVDLTNEPAAAALAGGSDYAGRHDGVFKKRHSLQADIKRLFGR